MEKKLKRFYFLLVIVIITVAAGYWSTITPSEEDLVMVGADTISSMKKEKVYASGEPIGIYIKTNGILVLGIQKVRGEDDRFYQPAKNKLESGDYILKMNGNPINTKQELIGMLQKNQEKEVVLTVERSNEEIETKIKPVYSVESKSYQIGAWIRNDTQGIGTVTFIKEDGSFAALGHGISDSDLGVCLTISGGSVYRTKISSIMKGKEGNPGELIGTIDYIPDNYLGNIYKNQNGGISGEILHHISDFQKGTPMEIADSSQVKEGKAYLRTSIGGKSKDYTIEIEKVEQKKADSLKSLKIKVTDPKLLSLTGGIIQGLSGSPIIQNGRLVGAVTHVLVENPARGYGILLQDMVY